MSETNLWKAYCQICGAEGEVLVTFNGKWKDVQLEWDFEKRWWRVWCRHWCPRYEARQSVKVPEGSIFVWAEQEWRRSR